jgi:hypothetical protein
MALGGLPRSRGAQAAELWSSLPAFHPVTTLLPIAKECILDFFVNALEPIFGLQRLLLEVLHLLLQLFSAIFGRSKLHRKLMGRLSRVFVVRFGGFGRLVQQPDYCGT